MSVDVVKLGRADTLPSMIQAVLSSPNEAVLLVLPPSQEHLVAENLDMARLAQAGREAGRKIGVVALDRRVHVAGRVTGVQVYNTVAIGKRRLGWNHPWFLPEDTSRPGKPTDISMEDRAAVHQRMAPLPRWARYLGRYTIIVLFFLAMAVLLLTAIFAYPSATITLKPISQPLEVSQIVVADPQYDQDSASGATVPGRLLVSVPKVRASVETTGLKEVSTAPARGTVTFVNRIAQPVVIPAGTRVSTSTGERIEFQTTQQITVPGRVGAEVDVEVIALELGKKGNLPPDKVNRVDGVLSAQLNVRNLTEIGGGSGEFRNAVRVEDVERLRDQIYDIIIEEAKAEMKRELTVEEALAEDSLRVVYTYLESSSHFVGEVTNELTMEIRAEVHSTAVNDDVAIGLVETAVADSIPSGFKLVRESVEISDGTVLGVDAQGRVSLELTATGLVSAEIDHLPHLSEITGESIPEAQLYLQDNLPLREVPTIEISPDYFENIPFIPARIYTNIVNE